MKVKYGILTYPTIGLFPKEGFSFDAGEGARFAVEDLSVTAKDNHWETWLGTLRWEEISRATAQVQVWQESKNPEVIDGENQDIDRRLNRYARALMLCDLVMPPHATPHIITGLGELEDGRLTPLDIRTYGKGPQWRQQGYVRLEQYGKSPLWERIGHNPPFCYGTDFFQTWRNLYEQITNVSQDDPSHFLINLAIYSFQQALGEPFVDFSVPAFGRTLETLVTLAHGEGRAVFAKRTKRFVPKIAELAFEMDEEKVSRILKESYGLRSDAVHGKPFGWGLGSRREEFLKEEVEYYVYLLETVARSTIRAFLADPELLAATKDRKALEGYWCRVDPSPPQTHCSSCKQLLTPPKEPEADWASDMIAHAKKLKLVRLMKKLLYQARGR